MKLTPLAALWMLFASVAAQTPAPRFQSGVELVEVTILAKDKAGRPVTDLRVDEITVVENGTPQKIVAFERVSLPIAPPPPTSAAPPEARDVSSNERIGESRVFVLVLDAMHVAPINVLAVRAHARQFVERHVGPNDMAAVFTPGGLGAATEDFTTDKARLIAAIERFTATKLASATVEREREARMGTVLHAGQDPDDFERAGRAQSLSDFLEALARNVERISARRKSVLLFSEGIDYNINDVMGEIQRNASDVMHAMSRAAGSLMRANVALYAIDPRRLGSAEGDLVVNPVYEEFPTRSLSEIGVEGEYAASLKSLHDLAESTGGFAAVSSNSVAEAFGRILQETSEYYVVAYAPAKPPKRDEFRPIAVKTSRAGVTVVARKGYMARQPAAPKAVVEAAPQSTPVTGPFSRPARTPVIQAMPDTAAATRSGGVDGELALLLSSPLPKAGLPLRVQAIPFKTGGKKADVRVIVEVLGGGLRFTGRSDRAEERIELASVTVDERGRAANGRATTINLALPPEELQRVKATGVRWLSKLELPPGRQQVRVAARAAVTGSSGMVTITIDVPKFDEPKLAMSGITVTSLPAVLMLTRGTGWMEKAIQTPPSASRTFVAGDHVTAAVELYGAGAAKDPVQASASVEREGSTETLRIRPVEQSATQAVFRFDTGKLPPGSYLLRVAATRGPGERTERRVPFEIVSRPQ